MIRQVFLAVCIFTLTACTVTAPVKPISSYEAHLQGVEQIQDWHANGRIAVKHPEESFSASFDWQLKDQQTTLRLTDMFGATVLLLEPNQQGYRLTINDEQYWGRDIESLLSRFTRIDFPVLAMQDWMLGRPYHKDDSITLNKEELAATHQSANPDHPYRVQYKKYQQVDEHALPQSFDVFYGDIKMKMRVSDWTLRND